MMDMFVASAIFLLTGAYSVAEIADGPGLAVTVLYALAIVVLSLLGRNQWKVRKGRS